MAYCTATEVASEFKGMTFSATTSVTDTEVAAFIAREDAFIDSRVALKYTVPVTGASSLLIMKKVCLNLVVGKIKNIMSVKTGDPKADQGGPGDGLIEAAMGLLKMIVDEDILLKDAVAAGVSSPVKSYLSNGGGAYTPKFDIESTQW